jgi:basic amino acid/polyamine antiporter, APA family
MSHSDRAAGHSHAPPTSQAATGPEPARTLPVFYVVMLAVGMVVGAGIFKSPASVAESAGTAQWVYLVWIAGGLISLIGALCYAELSTAFPNAGGDYHFLTRAYGSTFGFLFAFARFAVINTGSIALLGFVIGDYLNPVINLGPHGPAIWAFASVLLISLFNLRGKGRGLGADYAITVLEVLGLVILGVAAMVLVVTQVPPSTSGPGTPPGLASIGFAMVFVLLAFGGWSEMATLSAEVKDPQRGMVRALVIAVLVITGLFLIANWALLRGLGVEGLAASEAPAADLMARAFGPVSGAILSVAVAAAAITSVNATIVVGARTTFAACRDRLEAAPFLKPMGTWDAGRGIPAGAIFWQGVVSLLLVLLGAVYNGFETLVNYTAPVYWLFITASGLAVIVLRFKEPDVPRPFKVPLYPVLPLVFIAISAAMIWSGLTYVGDGVWFSVAVMAVGLMLALVLRRRS